MAKKKAKKKATKKAATRKVAKKKTAKKKATKKKAAKKVAKKKATRKVAKKATRKVAKKATKKKAAKKKTAKKKTAKKATRKVAKKATKKKATKKTAKKATKRKATARAAAKPAAPKRVIGPAKSNFDRVKKTRTKSQILNSIAESTGLTRKEVAACFENLQSLVGHDLKRGPGMFTIPGLLKVVVKRKPATKARKGVNPFTGEEMMFKAKPATNVVRARPLKNLKDMV